MGIESEFVNGQVIHRETGRTAMDSSDSLRSAAGRGLAAEPESRQVIRGQLLSSHAHILHHLTIEDMQPPPLARAREPEHLQFDRLRVLECPGSAPLQQDAGAAERRSESGSSSSQLSNIVFNARHQIEKISYPAENKTREFGRDANGEINSLTTTTPEGRFRYVREGSDWFLLGADSKKYPAPPVMLNENGEFSRRVKDSIFTTQRPDGTSYEERVNPLGARIAVDSGGRVEKIVNKEGVEFTARYEDGALAQMTQKNGDKVVQWSRSGERDEWKSDGAEPRVVKNLSITSDGNVSYTAADGMRHILRGNGVELLEGPGKSKFSFDEQGRIKSITNPDGQRTRTVEYEGDTANIKSVMITDKKTHEASRYIKQDGDTWAHVNQYGQTDSSWKGSIKITDEGAYCIKAAESGKDAWQVFRSDGKVQSVRIAADGSEGTLDEGGRLQSIARQDGGGATLRYDQRGLCSLTQRSENGIETNWSRQADGTWSSDSKTYPQSIGELKVLDSGDVQYTDSRGTSVTVHPDATMHSVRKDGSFADTGVNGLVTKAGLDKSNYRTFQYDNGQVAKIESVSANGSTNWTRSSDESDSRRRVSVSPEGFVSYIENGKTYIEAPNMAKLELNDKFQLTQVTLPNGSKRDIAYNDSGVIQSITDTRETEKGAKTQTLTRAADGPDGKSLYEVTTSNGKKKTVSDLWVDESGNYSYRSADGKEMLARASDLLKASDKSESVEDSRAALEELAESRGIKVERLKSFMDRFESRAETARKEGIVAPTEEQIAKTYDNLRQLLEGKEGSNYFDDKQRNRLCEEALYNISQPTRINQGANPTCNMTTGEIFMASRQPDKYAEVLRRVALDGQLTTTSGKLVNVHPSALLPTQEEGMFDPEVDYKSNCRNWASHVVQIFGINSFTKFQQPNAYLPAWGHEYRGGDANPCMGGDAIKQAVKELTGADMPYIEHGVAPTEEQLWEYKKAGNFPIGIPTQYSWNPQYGGWSEEHVQTIHDVREVNGQTQVYLDDQHGSWDDRGWISLDQLYARQRLQAPPGGRHGPKFVRR